MRDTHLLSPALSAFIDKRHIQLVGNEWCLDTYVMRHISIYIASIKQA